MLTLIGNVKTRALRVLWMLEELGLEYAHIDAMPRSEAAFAANPLGKIPALRDGDAVITDSVAIMTYLADKHCRLTAPAGTPERGAQDAVTLWLIDELDALLWSRFKYTRMFPEDLRVPDLANTLAVEFAQNVERLDKMLGDQDFLMGDEIRVPDLLCVQCLGWAKAVGLAPPPDRVAAYAKRLTSRTAYRAALAVNARAKDS